MEISMLKNKSSDSCTNKILTEATCANNVLTVDSNCQALINPDVTTSFTVSLPTKQII